MRPDSDVAEPKLTLNVVRVDGRQSSGALPGYQTGATVHIPRYTGIWPGQKITFMMRTSQGEFPEALASKTLTEADDSGEWVVTVTGQKLTELSWTIKSWYMYYTVEERSGTKTKSADLIVYLRTGGPLEALEPKIPE